MSAPTQNANIQALRALAAVLVVVGHALHETETIAKLVGRPAPDLSFVYWGFGVDIFFVISGFIMVYTSVDLFGRPGAWRTFLARRITRIVPLYWLLTTVLLIGGLIAPRLLNVPIDDLQHVLASYAFIPSERIPGEIRPVMALGWTLNMEMFFYVIFAATLALPFRAGMMALTAAIGGFAIAGFLFKPEQVQLAFWTQSIILEFLIGALLAVGYLKGARLAGPAALVCGALGLVGMIKYPGFDTGADAPDALRWGVPALLFVASAALAKSSTSRLVLWGAVIGNASYSLYLIHPFVLRPMRNIWAHLVGASLPLTVYVIAVTILSTGVAFLLYRWVERPMLRLVQKRRPDLPKETRSGAAVTAS